jgi:glycosyltransferase involved in cell wall biosynthesis
MTFELLVSCVKKDPHELASQMHIASDAVIVSQKEETDSTEEFELNGNRIKVIRQNNKGVGLSRNTCIDNSTADVILFSDEDIVYDEGYMEKVIAEFNAHPEADILLFNVKVCEERRTYWNDSVKKISWYNCGRYPAYSIAAKTTALKQSGVRFSLLFGGGAKYSNGEDSLFLNDCLKAGLKINALPVCLGEEVPRPSTWFFGYSDKYFYDRGVLYYFLYGSLAKLWGIRWLLKTKSEYSDKYPYKQAKKMLFQGIADHNAIDRSFENGNIVINK